MSATQENQYPGFALSLIVTCLATMAFVFYGEPGLVQRVAVEDGLFENLTAVFYVLGALLCIFALARGRFVLVSAIWLLLCIVFVGEETSWFQRLIGYSVPAIETINTQSEFNFHNLFALQDSALFGDGGPFGFLPSDISVAEKVFLLGLVVYFLVLPLILSLGFMRFVARKMNFPGFNLDTLAAMWVVIGAAFLLVYLADAGLKGAIAETREMFYALFIMVYVAGFASRRGAFLWPPSRESAPVAEQAAQSV